MACQDTAGVRAYIENNWCVLLLKIGLNLDLEKKNSVPDHICSWYSKTGHG